MAEKKPRAVSRRVSAKKTTKKSVPKPKSASRAKAKKPVKKTTKKTTKKATVKKTAKNKKVETKESSSVTSGKLKNNKFLAKKINPESKKSDSVSVHTDHQVTVEDSSVTIFSRVRTDNAVLLVARVLGLLFIFVGAAMSMVGISHVERETAFAKLTNDFSHSLVASLLTSDSVSGTHIEESLSGTNTLDTTPEVHITVPDSPLTEFAEINLSVVMAEKIQLSAQHIKSKMTYSLGYAQSIDTTLWKYKWDTATVPDGEYQLIIHITNRYGAYIQKHTEQLFVTNRTIDANTNASTSITTDHPSASSTGETDIQNQILNDDTIIKTDITKSPIEFTSNLSVKQSNPIHGYVDLETKTSASDFAEFYIRQNDSLRDVFLGLGVLENGSWHFVWDTQQTPNGTYSVRTKHKNEYGYYWSQPVEVVVKNEYSAVLNTAEETLVKNINDIHTNSENPIVVFTDLLDESTKIDVNATTTVEVISGPDLPDQFKNVLRTFETEIQNSFQQYAKTLRSDDIVEQRKALHTIDELRNSITLSVVGNESISDSQIFKTKIEEHFNRLVSDISQFHTVLENRVGDVIFEDSDSDGIADYDEVAIYKTNPFAADSDNDGFTDEAEILGGFDPNSDTQESPIVYESPKELGVTRDDILVVENVVADTSISKSRAAAVLSGRALPNSFATLYIFSTPTVITVKTDSDGSWVYRFDKELEDGQHQVYVGLTDNSGKIVAKSTPFTFIKEAQAFTPIDVESEAGIIISEPSQPSLFDLNALLIGAGSVVLSLGFILLIIALYFGRRQEKNTVKLTHAV